MNGGKEGGVVTGGTAVAEQPGCGSWMKMTRIRIVVESVLQSHEGELLGVAQDADDPEKYAGVPLASGAACPLI